MLEWGIFIFSTMAIFKSHNLLLLTKKTRKQLVVFVLITLFHNFLIFPAHAANPTTEHLFEEPKYQILTSPDGVINLEERLVSNNVESSLLKKIDQRPELAKNFKAIPDVHQPSLLAVYKEQKEAGVRMALADTTTVPAGKLVTMTAYNSEVAQTDGDPCTTANGFNVCKHGVEDTVAANFLPLGTKIQIPELFGDRTFVVRDRTARRFSDRVDVWMIKKSDALQFGVRHAHIVVVE